MYYICNNKNETIIKTITIMLHHEKEIYLSNGHTIRIENSEGHSSPREDRDNLFEFAFYGKYSHLGDNHDLELDTDDYANSDAFFNAIKARGGRYIVRKVYGYSHSGLSITTEPNGCKFDSGVLGYAYIPKERYMEWINSQGFKHNPISKSKKKVLQEIFEGEVNTLNWWVNGEIYGFIQYDDEEEEVDAVWGFYGDDVDGIVSHLDLNDELKEEARTKLNKD